MSDQKKIIISDVTLRDGNHAVNHTINLNSFQIYFTEPFIFLVLYSKENADIKKNKQNNVLFI
jgi:hypothetical protein